MSMKSGVLPGGDAPAFTAAPVTKSDVTFLWARALFVGGAGNVTVIMAGDNTDTPVTFVGVNAGVWMPIQVKKVMAATTATNIMAVW